MILTLIILSVFNILLVGFLLFKVSQHDNSRLRSALDSIEKNQVRLESMIREEQQKNLNAFSEALFSRLNDTANANKNLLDAFAKQLSELTQVNEKKLDKLRDVVEAQLKHLQEDNSAKLERMRETVDEKLHSTLEKRLGESFNLVSERLEQVKEGLGEMKTLASGVGDLKKVLTNVKTRGTWGEIQLGNLLEQLLTAEQYDRNVITKKGSKDPVEFAVRLPGKEDNAVVYLPIDAKFPKEDYERLQTAQEAGDIVQIEEAVKAIEARIKLEAKKIKDKYIDPPATTDFAIMYLPTEGLFAEVIRRDGLCDLLQREYRISVAGPTTISAMLNSLQLGFRTLAVEKRASEVWNLLGKVKTEFGKFGDVLAKTKEKLGQASKEIERAEVRTRAIERNLKDVQELPASKPAELIESTLGDFDETD